MGSVISSGNNGLSLSAAGFFLFSGCLAYHSATLSGVWWVCKGKPCCNANQSAPSPTNKICGVFSMTRLATAAAWRIFSSPATAPAFNVAPSMTQASRETVPIRLPMAPKPTLRTVPSSSTAWAPASAASSAAEPLARSGRAVSAAVRPNGQVAMTTGAGMRNPRVLLGSIPPIGYTDEV
jgi:hypothetical protein